MKIAPIPLDEEERLVALRGYNVLDTFSEQEFDNLTKLASYVCQTPIALISLVDENRQWFKSKVGLDASETPRDFAFCAHAILQHDVFVVSDSHKDERFHDNPLVVGGPHVRFYAGAPLQTPNGKNIGTLCVIDTVPREMDAQQIMALQALAMHVVSQLELKSHVVALRAAREAAENAARTKARFLASMSHEIRTPMNGVIGHTSLLMETDLSNDQREMVAAIKSSGDTLLTLIDDILDFSKIEAGKIEIEYRPFDIRKAVNDAIKVVSPIALEKAISLAVRIDDRVPAVVVSDYVRSRQVLLNLLSNAVKFTEKGHVKVLVNLEGIVDAKALIKVTVEDSGIGMSSDEQNKLFQEFSQVDVSTTRKYGGTGLGLAICKQLCALLGGKIWVESQPGRGSAFSFTFLASSGEGLEPVNVVQFMKRKDCSLLGAEHPLRILLAEDNITNQTLAVKYFKKLGYEIDVVENGERALDAVKKNFFDIVFMDAHMPVLDGNEATKRIRVEVPESRQPHIIAFSASAMQEDKQLCFDAGMNDFLKKPLEISDLVSTLQRFICARSGKATMSKVQNAVQEKCVDFPSMLKKFDNDFEMFQTVAEVYLADCQNYLDRIETSLKKSDAHELKAAAHALKGAASNFSASLVTTTAMQMENFGREGKMGDANELFTLLVEEAKLLKSKLSDFVSAENAA